MRNWTRLASLLLVVCASCAYALPDLQVTVANQEATGCLERGTSYHGKGVIKNVGDAPALNFRVLVRMYGEDSFSDVASLAPGAEQTFPVDRVLPADAPCQLYGIRVVVDVDNTVVEASEGEDNAKNGSPPLYPCDCPNAAPSSTPTSVAPTATASNTATNTSLPTETPTQTQTGMPSATASASPSASPTVSNTALPTETHTNVPPTVTLTSTPTNTQQISATPTSTGTLEPSATPTKSATSSPIPTDTKTPTPSWTPSLTRTPSFTRTPSETRTEIATRTETMAPTESPTNTPVLPDLSYTEPVVDPSTACLVREEFNTPITRVQIRNNGGSATGPFRVTINYIGMSSDRDVAGLDVGEASEMTLISLPFIPDCDSNYGIMVNIDVNHQVIEADEGNNVLSEPLFFGCCEVSPTPTETEVGPTATSSPTASNTHTASPTFTRTRTSSPTPTRTETGRPTATRTLSPTVTPTQTEAGVCDSGAYEMTIFGDIIRLGSPPIITGGFHFPFAFAKDMEKARVNNEDDLVVLTGDGLVSFVQNNQTYIQQDFVFPPNNAFPMGRAVDLEMSPSSEGFWVLTDFGGIYRAGDTIPPGEGPAVAGTLAFPLGYYVPFGNMRNPSLPNPGGSSLRAVSLVVIETTGDSLAEGYVILDSQGGHYQLNPDGSPVEAGAYASAPHGSPLKLLDPSIYEWPFFPGLDIARDMQLHSSHRGLVILDGWDGIHPVPVDDPSNPVFYTRNEDPEHPGTLLTTVGMPYIVQGFDDPSTEPDESNPWEFGIDAESVFVGFEFSDGCQRGFYTLDKFGGIFAFGDTRADPGSLTPTFSSPLFYPHLYAQTLKAHR